MVTLSSFASDDAPAANFFELSVADFFKLDWLAERLSAVEAKGVGGLRTADSTFPF